MKRKFLYYLILCAAMAFNAIDASAQEMVDLGLSVKWASCNLGANTPAEYGSYFAWGDIKGQMWSNSNRQWSNGGFLEKPEYRLKERVLVPECDAAHVILGESWRMPTEEEFRELIDNCNLEWKENYNRTGCKGVLFTSKKPGFTDKSIFLPAAGEGSYSLLENCGSFLFYWTSTWNGKPEYLYVDGGAGRINIGGEDAKHGMPIRPVTDAVYTESLSGKRSVSLQRLPEESDYQLQMREDIVNFISSEEGVTLLSTTDGITFEEDGVVYGLEMDSYRDDPNII